MQGAKILVVVGFPSPLTSLDDTPHLNELEVRVMSAIILGACLALHGTVAQANLAKQGEADSPSLARLILSTNMQERKDAYNYAMVSVIGLNRARSKNFLLNVVHTNPLIPPRNAPNNEEEHYAPRRIALSILAEWHDSELIPVFIANIDYVACDPNRSGLSKAPNNEYYAAVKGLINIGKPAIQPCLKELAKNENNPEVVRFRPRDSEDYRLSIYRRENLLFVISRVAGNAEAKKILEKEIQQLITNDPEGAKNLRIAAESPILRTP